MRNLILTHLGLLMASIPFASPAYAQQSIRSFNVNITIQAECEFESATDLDFGTAGVITKNIDAQSTISVICTAGTPYGLSLDKGQGANATTEQRKMTGNGTETIIYSLYRDPARANVWGETDGTNTIGGTGDGKAQQYPVYGRVPPTTAELHPGTYTDVVTAILKY